MGFLSPFRKRSADDPPPTEAWPLYAFGKLPVYKDFISSGLTDDVSREFRDWLSNGFSRHWSSRDDCRSTEIPLHAFLLRLPGSHKMAVGALWGSTDQGGLRKFPFALFTILPAGKPVASVLTALDYLPAFEIRAREIRRKYEAGGSLAAVYQELRGARIEVPVRKEEEIRVRLAETLSRSRIGPLATALFGNDAVTQWASLLSGLDAAARSPASGAAAFRIPLAGEMLPIQQLKLWTVRLTKASPGPTGVLYRTGGEAPCGVVFFRDARAEDILLFHPAAIPTDFVEEIPKPVRRASAEASIEPAAAVDTPAPVPQAIIAPAISVPATEPPAISVPATIVPATEPPAISVPAISVPVISVPATEPPPTGAAPPPEPAPPAETILPSEAAPPAGPPPAEEIFLLGAAAPAAEVRPAPLPAAPAGEAPPEVPTGSQRPAVPQTPAVSEPPAPAAPPAELSAPAPSLSGPSPQADPPGWELPLASLLEVG